MRDTIIAVLALTASFAARELPSQTSPTRELTLEGRGRVSAIYDIEAAPPYAYALENGMLRVLDVRNPGAVREVGSVAFEPARSRTVLRYPYLYLTGFNSSLGVIDISNPTRPRWVANCPGLAGANGDVFEVADDRGYLVRQEGTAGAPGPLFLDVLDVAAPGCPRKLGSVALGASVMMRGEYGGIAQANGRAFMMIARPAGVTNRSELVIVDATASDAPRVVRTVLFPEGKRYADIEVRGDLLFLLESTPQKPNGLAIYRLRAEGEPELIGEALNPDLFFPIDLIVSGDVIYATFKGGAQLVTFDISNIGAPTIANRYRQTDRSSAGLGMALVGKRLYLTGDSGPAPIFDVATPRTPRLLGRWAYDGGLVDNVMLNGASAVLSGAGGDLFFFDVSNHAAPRRLGAYFGAPPVRAGEWQWNVAVAVNGRRAFIAYETVPAEVLDISRPSKLTVLGTVMPRGLVHAVALTATHAFLGYRAPADGKTPLTIDPSSWTARGGIETIDLRDSHAPRSVGRLDLDAAVVDLARHEHFLVAAHADGSITVVDVRNPSRPAILGRVAGSGSNAADGLMRPARVAVSPDSRLAYVAHTDAARDSGTLAVIDLRDPARSRRLGQLILPRSGRTEPALAVDGSRVAVLLDGREVLIADARDPMNLVAAGRFELKTFAQGLAFRDGALYVAAGEAGLMIFRVPSVTAPPR